LSCEHTSWNDITYSWEDPYTKTYLFNDYTCYATGVATATCDDCGAILTEKVSTTETTSGGTYCNSRKKYQNKATFSQLADSTQTYTYRTGSYGDTHSSGYLSAWTTTKEATCTEAGEKSRTCSACGDTITEAIPATGHGNWRTTGATVQPTCAKDGGYTRICGNCQTYSEYVVLPATGQHSFDNEWKEDNIGWYKTCTKCNTNFYK
jgi:hypothetical protein